MMCGLVVTGIYLDVTCISEFCLQMSRDLYGVAVRKTHDPTRD